MTATTTEQAAVQAYSLLTDNDIYLFNEGNHFRLYQKLGAHPMRHEGVDGAYFAVWAPNAQRVSVIGDFNSWNKSRHCLIARGHSGIWEGFIPGTRNGATYKYHIVSRHGGHVVDKTDPFGFRQEVAPSTASLICDLHYQWKDQAWMIERGKRCRLNSPISVYEMHIGSWARVPEENNRHLNYRELAPKLTAYIKHLGFTHIEFLPLMEHPFYGSWGYQSVGYFAPTSRYGTPQDLMYLIDYLHQHDIGVILDWVPSHFPTDEHGLAYFDGTHLFEHADVRQGFHPDWNSYIFNYGRHEVRSFLISSAFYWLDKYHVDGLRVDAVASMLYLDYSRKLGEWIPNEFGGRENLQAISFLRRFNEAVYESFPDVQTVAEESTAWPMVSRPNYVGGLGFGFKWDMGWMHDTLKYFSLDSIYRKYHHNLLTFRAVYAFTENFMLPLSHDEVVHGKGSLLGKMPGDDWQRFANLRLLLGNMYAQPSKKLLFMGCEFGQRREWNHDSSLDWHLLDNDFHSGIQRWIEDLNRLYRGEPALHEGDAVQNTFEWVDGNDSEQSTISWLRWNADFSQVILAVFNLTPLVRENFRVGVPFGGHWEEILNSDAPRYCGSGVGNFGGVNAAPVGWHGRPNALHIILPPLAALFFKHEK